MRGFVDTTLSDKVCQWLAAGRWFSPGTPISSTNKTDCNNITEILLKLWLNTIPPPPPQNHSWHLIYGKNCEVEQIIRTFDRTFKPCWRQLHITLSPIGKLVAFGPCNKKYFHNWTCWTNVLKHFWHSYAVLSIRGGIRYFFPIKMVFGTS
jgi:hypothetical protein